MALRVLDAFPGAALVVDAEGVIEAAWARSAQLLGDGLVGRPLHEALGIRDEGAAGLLQLWVASVIGHDVAIWPLYADQAPTTAESVRADGTRQALAVEASPLTSGGIIERLVIFARPVEAGASEPAIVAVSSATASAVDIETFRCESGGLFADCEAALARLDIDPAARHAVERLFRSLHTVKGTARAFGLSAVQQAAHAIEDSLEALRNDAAPVVAETIADLRARLEALRALVDASGKTATAEVGSRASYNQPLELLIAALDAVAAVGPAGEAACVARTRRKIAAQRRLRSTSSALPALRSAHRRSRRSPIVRRQPSSKESSRR
ncbi:MAG: Hpt domain-containing protein [Myxococcales bacterium]|nr:Hpt domain-containing protein [Myxococcales bacterium]